MEVTKLTCSNCGAAHLHEENPGKYGCEYCGATYLIEINPTTGKLSDAKITGSMQDTAQVFAVHERLVVKGSMNDITILQTAKDAQHVATLTIKGSMNDIDVVLLDGASCEVKGSMNDIRRE